MVSNNRSDERKVYFFSCSKTERRKENGNYSYHLPMQPPNPLLSARLDRSGSRAEVAVDTASGGVQRSDKVCDLADASASFKSDMWKYFWSPPPSQEMKR